MATVEISKNPEKYFDSFQKPEKHKYSEIKLTRAYTVPQIKRALNISDKILKEYNFEIRPIAYRSPLYLPKGITIKVPQTNSENLALLSENLKKLKIYAKKGYTEHMHVVSRRETLFDISRIYKVNMHKIIAFNNIDNPSRIFPGMKLKIPGSKTPLPKKKLIKKRSSKKVATLSQGNTKDKEVFKFDGDLFTKTYGKVWKKSKKSISVPVPMILPEINLNSYNLELEKVSKNVYHLIIDTEETVGHYADWGLVRIKTIRKINKMNYRFHFIPGKKMILPIMDDNVNRFKELRNEYHLSMQEDFFSNFKVIGSKIYKVKRGDTLMTILVKENLPFWLVRQHQKDGTLPNTLSIGQKINLPILESATEDATDLPTEAKED